MTSPKIKVRPKARIPAKDLEAYPPWARTFWLTVQATVANDAATNEEKANLPRLAERLQRARFRFTPLEWEQAAWAVRAHFLRLLVPQEALQVQAFTAMTTKFVRSRIADPSAPEPVGFWRLRGEATLAAVSSVNATKEMSLIRVLGAALEKDHVEAVTCLANLYAALGMPLHSVVGVVIDELSHRLALSRSLFAGNSDKTL